MNVVILITFQSYSCSYLLLQSSFLLNALKKTLIYSNQLQENAQKVRDLRRVLEDLRHEKEATDAKSVRADELEETVRELRQGNRSLEEKIARYSVCVCVCVYVCVCMYVCPCSLIPSN